MGAAPTGSERSKRSPGRPRDEQAGANILASTIELLTEEGFSGVSVDAVAAAAGVSKATIYRRWSSREALLLDAAACLSPVAEQVPDTGTLRGDLRALFRGFLPALTAGLPGQILPQMIAEGTRSPEIRELLGTFAAERLQRWRTVLERGVARGEMAAGLDAEVVLDCLTGPLFFRLLVSGEPLDDALAEHLVDLVLHGIAAPRPAG